MNTFFKDANYKVPVSSNYLKLTEGNHKFRILGSAIVGWEYFDNDNKPVRSREPFDETPNIKPYSSVNHFWFFPVYNWEAEKIQLLEIKQKTIQNQMKDYLDNSDWGTPEEVGQPFGYDFTIIRKGTTKNDTEYKVITSPHKPIDEEIVKKYEEMEINLDVLFEGGNPFKGE